MPYFCNIFMHSTLIFLLAFTLSGAKHCGLCEDGDADGYGNGPFCIGPDCDDDNAVVNPAALEDCYDGQDNDCDQLIDSDDLECNLNNMVLVPAGPFYRGTCNEGSDPACYPGEPGYSRTYSTVEMPGREIDLAGFYIDMYEVSVAEFRVCIEAGACQAKWLGNYNEANFCNYDKPNYDEHPVNCASWYAADQYCRFAGKRLPSEAEWEKAARGESGFVFPWGNTTASCKLANYSYYTNLFCVGGTSLPGSYPDGVSPYGAFDMAGNLWEWVQDWYDPDYYDPAYPLPDYSPSENPQGPTTGTYRLIRGGSWVSSEGFIRTTMKHFYTPETGMEDVGFRCVRSE
jgi:formylglycine-generating enzyme required for sulfatase activity